ncbi:hypothetical protein COU01_00350 [Candidatus Falkowbacteria bacterium CG10_big_fil_rev_8_21_14_0_10_44_15]|uniref:HAD family hydrolase n=1 Tax=Candidatus Falkowbacteria bacterium CG10_big_fil_rev_8_21_14_0_10_44_15 TaxID=1974569 RepID=A0A2H0V2Q9_9BACT|nr:MAG: hypothetical protein COU01_00350 [Candidatus Falkowbacteria bacterium CG10_big_fil_rev_8_21_14_0_10_44_15]
MNRNKKKKLIIFDMDGTLYAFKEGSFAKSALKKQVLENAKNYIANVLKKSTTEAENILMGIEKKYGESISIAMEKEFGINRYDYFNIVWNIPAERFIDYNPELKTFLLNIAQEYDYVLVSDAPSVWVNNVLQMLDIRDMFQGKIYAGEGDRRKGLYNKFQYNIASKFGCKSADCVVVGDQENTDIIPAKQNGMRTILVSDKTESSVADCKIKDIFNLKETLEYIFFRPN